MKNRENNIVGSKQLLCANTRKKLLGVTASLVMCLVFGVSSSLAASPSSKKLLEHPRIKSMVQELTAEGVYTDAELTKILSQSRFQQSILDAMQKPAEYKFTWGKYRNLFLKEDRIDRGVEFWAEHKADFDRAESTYGVPASMIAAIIGVESKFGKYKGAHKVLDSLMTLVVGYERRSKFFASELKHFLRLCKENELDAVQIQGSYAGAMGFPQFIASSYRNYAVDFSGDGKIDLINQPIDAIGSIANYFVKNGWLAGEPVTSRPVAKVADELVELANRKRKVRYSAEQLRGMGASIDQRIPSAEKLNIIMLNASEIVPQDGDETSYIVRAGDTACEIAEKHNITCKQLFKLNDLDKKGAIFRGQKLKLPTTSEPRSHTKTVSSKKVDVKNSKWQVSADTQSSPQAARDAAAQTREQLHYQPQYFYTHENFYVITRYNQSVLYAMAVYDLSEAIAKKARNMPLTGTVE